MNAEMKNPERKYSYFLLQKEWEELLKRERAPVAHIESFNSYFEVFHESRKKFTDSLLKLSRQMSPPLSKVGIISGAVAAVLLFKDHRGIGADSLGGASLLFSIGCFALAATPLAIFAVCHGLEIGWKMKIKKDTFHLHRTLKAKIDPKNYELDRMFEDHVGKKFMIIHARKRLSLESLAEKIKEQLQPAPTVVSISTPNPARLFSIRRETPRSGSPGKSP
jgi:hypothetical protein